MARQFYKPETKKAFTKAALDARSAKKSWADAHAAAKAAGYKGKLPALIKLMRLAKGGGKSRNTGKIGRPKGSGTGMATSIPSTLIEKAINAEVQRRVNAALDKAVAALKSVKAS